MNTIQLKRIAGTPLTDEEQNLMTNLAFACPLLAGNAVYRARSVLLTQGNYTFDDATNCEPDQKVGGEKRTIPEVETRTPAHQWYIYPNPAQHRLWIDGSQMEALQSIQLFNSLGHSILSLPKKGNDRMEILLPNRLPAGLYFLRLQLRNGETRTKKILLQP